MLKNVCILILVLFTLISCGQTKSDTAFQNYLNSIQNSKDYVEIRIKLKDSIQSWIDRQLYELLFYKNLNWKIDDAVFFDKDKKKALLLILAQVKDSLYPHDYVKIVGAEKISGSWEFYYPSYPVVIHNRDINKNKPYSFEQLSISGRNELTEDGFVKCGIGCNINYDYVDSDIWFADWKRKMHNKFLNNALPRHPIAKPGELFF
jgi:hypothetical protein